MLLCISQNNSRLAAYSVKTWAIWVWSLSSVLLTASGVAAYGNEAVNASGPVICAQMGDAMLKTAKTPYTSTSTIALGKPQSDGSGSNTPRTSQTIFTGDAVFVRSGSHPWHKIEAAIGSLQELVRKASSRFADCQDLGNEQLAGTPVTVFYAYLGAAPSAYGTKTKLWVDKAQGVLVRSETDTTSNEGSRHSVIEYKYGRVSAPQL